MGIEETFTEGAPQTCARDEHVGVVEGVVRYQLLHDRATTTLAPKLSVPGVEAFLFGIELVCVALDGLPGQFWV